MKQLTVKEALDQGYEYYVYNDEGFQSLKHISDMDMDFSREDILIIKKESYNPPGLNAKDIAELLAETIEHNHSSDSGDDTEQVYDAIIDLDFSEAERIIDEALSKLVYYRATDIKLVE